MSTTILIPAKPLLPVQGSARFSVAGLKGSIWIAARKLSLMYTIYNERRQLRKLSDAALRDMGLSREDVELECSRKFLDIPNCRH